MPRILWVLYTNYTLEFLVFPGIVEKLVYQLKDILMLKWN